MTNAKVSRQSVTYQLWAKQYLYWSQLVLSRFAAIGKRLLVLQMKHPSCILCIHVFFLFVLFCLFFSTLETAKPEKSPVIPVAKKHVWTFTEGCEINFFFLNTFGDGWTRESRDVMEHVCMQHIETDQFAQSRVVVVVSPAQAASVFYSPCAVV